MMITATADVDLAVSCLSVGAMDYLTKPFHLEDVRARVGQALDRRLLQIENRDYKERLEERVREQAGRIEQLFLAGLQSLAEALEVKDPYTRGHSVRVSRYCSIIGSQLRLDREVLPADRASGNVHDIGKNRRPRIRAHKRTPPHARGVRAYHDTPPRRWRSWPLCSTMRRSRSTSSVRTTSGSMDTAFRIISKGPPSHSRPASQQLPTPSTP